jgi:hypothetical protein
MLKKILDGLLFGFGFAVAFVVVWAVSMWFVVPRLWESSPANLETREPEFKKPAEVQIAAPKPGVELEKREFNFFKNAKSRMQVPAGGGILAMSPMSTPKGAKRPSTYQLWMTESKLWQIRTIEEKTEIEELPYPKDADTAALDKLMHKNLGFGARQSSMTVSAQDVGSLKRTGETDRDESMNGKLKISVEGVVFIQPNPYGQ